MPLAVKKTTKKIIKSVEKALSQVDSDQIETMVNWIIQAKDKKILIVGMGRSGLVGRSFAMRLMHLGFEIYVMGETITPAIGKDDLIIAISGSGSTKLVVTASQIAKDVKARIIAITSYPDSELGRIADHVVELRGRTKVAQESDYFLRQILGAHEPMAPLGTIFEASALIFLDSVVVELMERMGKTEDDLKQRHATIE
ncbi:MAG: 6-phospho-3-hexuloisomerase [Candidatus Bathyarchaeia archaeon]